MNILVTGSEGTLGTSLVNVLRSRDHEVFTIDLQHGSHPNHRRADVANWRELSEAGAQIKRPDVVYHLAAEFGRMNGEEFYERLWRTNVIGTRNILELQRELSFKLIFASSSEVYGDLAEDVLHEDLIPDASPVYENDYALTKRVGEQMVRRFARQFGGMSMILRFFNAYGPGEHYNSYRSVVCLFVWRLLHGLPIDVYEGYHRVFMYIADFTPSLANASDAFMSGGIMNIGGTEYRSVEELAHIVQAETGASHDLLRFVGSDRHNTRNKRPDISRATKLLNHNPKVLLEEGVRRTVAWMRAQM
ncbi:MAG: NAD(P)-dependent oxidoreductase [Sulfitobacter sp.]|nr:NAD(P)-dependent oxidoreductase [Sulfitobacter sp.]